MEEIPWEGSNITEEAEEPVCQVVKVLPTDGVRFSKRFLLLHIKSAKCSKGVSNPDDNKNFI